jgi:hypothetical protein
MAKKKDQHRSGFMVRLPEEFRTVLESLQQKNERPMTIELQRALILYARQEGVEAPASAIVGRQAGS